MATKGRFIATRFDVEEPEDLVSAQFLQVLVQEDLDEKEGTPALILGEKKIAEGRKAIRQGKQEPRLPPLARLKVSATAQGWMVRQKTDDMR